MTFAFTSDVDFVVENNNWTIIEHEGINSIPHIKQLGHNGTLTLWEKLDRLTGSRGSAKLTMQGLSARRRITFPWSFTGFSRQKGLQRITIHVNNRELDPIDPFNTKHSATQPSPKEAITPDVRMQAFTLPHRSQYDYQQEYEKYGLDAVATSKTKAFTCTAPSGLSCMEHGSA